MKGKTLFLKPKPLRDMILRNVDKIVILPERRQISTELRQLL